MERSTLSAVRGEQVPPSRGAAGSPQGERAEAAALGSSAGADTLTHCRICKGGRGAGSGNSRCADRQVDGAFVGRWHPGHILLTGLSKHQQAPLPQSPSLGRKHVAGKTPEAVSPCVSASGRCRCHSPLSPLTLCAAREGGDVLTLPTRHPGLSSKVLFPDPEVRNEEIVLKTQHYKGF